MNLLEAKNHLALETTGILFRAAPDMIFIGGTALNTFYIDYRYSEDLDLGYLKKNPKSELEQILISHGYQVDRTNFDFRDVITLEGVSIKLDIIEYKPKFSGTTEKLLGQTQITTLSLEEFILDKTICFFTREDLAAMGRDAYDLFSIQQKYKQVLPLLTKTKNIVRKNIVSLNHNYDLFLENQQRIGIMMQPYLRKEVDISKVSKFLYSLRGVFQ